MSVPGSVPDLGTKESCIPVLVVQNPGYQKGGSRHSVNNAVGVDFGSGWDIVMPAGWSMAFWIAFIYRGAKAVGLREQKSLAFEAGELTFPDCCPDTPSATETSSSRAADLRAAHDRRPPAKRCNYEKMGVPAPFHCPWLELVRGWMRTCEHGKDCGVDQQFYCIRTRSLLRLLNDVCSGVAYRSKSTDQNRSVECSAAADLSTELLQRGPAIVKVQVMMSGRGAPAQFALICLPSEEDVLAPSRGRTDAQGVVGNDPTEPIRRDPIFFRYPSPATVLGSTARPTLGFVVEGGFSHATGRGSGVGFVSVLGLKTLLERKRDRASRTTVLVRCTRSLQYRPAELRIVC